MRLGWGLSLSDASADSQPLPLNRVRRAQARKRGGTWMCLHEGARRQPLTPLAQRGRGWRPRRQASSEADTTGHCWQSWGAGWKPWMRWGTKQDFNKMERRGAGSWALPLCCHFSRSRGPPQAGHSGPRTWATGLALSTPRGRGKDGGTETELSIYSTVGLEPC